MCILNQIHSRGTGRGIFDNVAAVIGSPTALQLMKAAA